MIRLIGNCNYYLKSMLVDMGTAMVFFYMRSLVPTVNSKELVDLNKAKGETIHRMYRNRDSFGDSSVHDTWRPLTIQTI
jgi:hypothetical protein